MGGASGDPAGTVLDPGSRLRLFVALDLSREARASLAAWRDKALAGRDDLRAVDEQALHVTLVFLGQREGGQVAELSELVLEAARARSAPVLRPKAVAPVPPRRPRLFALDLDDEGARAAAVQAAVSDALSAASLYTPEERPFWAHLTLARVRGGGRRGQRGARVPPLEAPPPPPGPLECREVTLYRSHLSPRGARYEALARVPLSSSGPS